MPRGLSPERALTLYMGNVEENPQAAPFLLLIGDDKAEPWLITDEFHEVDFPDLVAEVIPPFPLVQVVFSVEATALMSETHEMIDAASIYAAGGGMDFHLIAPFVRDVDGVTWQDAEVAVGPAVENNLIVVALRDLVERSNA